MTAAWRRLGLRGRLALSIGAIVLAAFAVLFTVHREVGDLLFGGVVLLAALLAAYLLADRTAAPLRRMAATAAAVEAGDLAPRIGGEPGAAVEVRALADSFDRMLDRLEDAFARQRRFVADASHELRTPLTAIRGQLEVLASEPEPRGEDVRRVEAVVMREIGRIEVLVDDLLALASLEEATPPRREPIDLPPFLAELAREGGATAGVGPVPAGSLDADREQLRRLLLNLLLNARRHAGPEGRVELSAAAESGRLTILVDDDGPGIPAAERERVFERFHRVGAARDRAGGGAGLGLSIARAIATAHGGAVAAAESPLGGARIRLELPGFRPRPGAGGAPAA